MLFGLLVGQNSILQSEGGLVADSGDRGDIMGESEQPVFGVQ